MEARLSAGGSASNSRKDFWMKTNKCIVTQDFTCSGTQLHLRVEAKFSLAIIYLPHLMQDDFQGMRETLQKKVKSSSEDLATLT